MKLWRKIVSKEWHPTVWTLRLECGHVAFRSHGYSQEELPAQVLCQSCDSLIGQQVKNRVGTRGTITTYKDGLFGISWNKGDATHWTLDKLREESELV